MVSKGPFFGTNLPTAKNMGGAVSGDAPRNRAASAPDGLISTRAAGAPRLCRVELIGMLFTMNPDATCISWR